MSTTQSTGTTGTTHTDSIPAKRIDRAPQYQFAVVSVRKGSDTAELESSFGDQWRAEQAFEVNYSKWGLVDVNFYLVDWSKLTILRAHRTWEPSRIGIYPNASAGL